MHPGRARSRFLPLVLPCLGWVLACSPDGGSSPGLPGQPGNPLGPADHGASPSDGGAPSDAWVPLVDASDESDDDAWSPAYPPDAGREDLDAGSARATGDAGVSTPPPPPPAAEPCGPFPADYLPFLDDTGCLARTPTDRDRDFVCPVVSTDATAITASGEIARYLPAGEPVEVDGAGLLGLVPTEDVRMTVILVRRVDGRPVYRTLGNGREEEIVQPWSSTKFLAVANAAARLRVLSGYALGLGARVDGVPLGDLVTVVHGYEESRYSSNGVARWFHDVGGRARANALVHEWLGRPATETFGGNYGAPSAALGYELTEGAASVRLSPDETTGPANQLSTLTLAEALKRLVMHREDAATRLPGIQWRDLRVLFYGAEDSAWYARERRQGMEADTAVYLAQALDLDEVERRSQGHYRLFGKLGAGYARGGELVHVGYGCLPALDARGEPRPDEGLELFVAAHLSADGDLAGGDARLAELYRRVLGAASRGELQ